ncbi:MAG: sugar transferase [Lachnospiraceae bacterium]|nr:sugar transferase [Lachnospiraceae bacterium]
MYQKTSNGWLKHWDFILIEIICIQVSFVLAYFFRHARLDMWMNESYRNMALFLLIDDLCVIYFLETFKNILKRGPYREFAYALRHTTVVILLAIFYVYFTKQGENISRITMLYCGLIHVLLSYLTRMLRKMRLARKMKKSGDRSLIVIANKDKIEDIIRTIKNHNYEFYRISGAVVIDKNEVGTEILGVPVVSDFEHSPEYVCHGWVDEVFVVTKLGDPEIVDIVKRISETGVTMHMALSEITHIDDRPQILEEIADQDVITTSIGYATTGQLFTKRLVDVIGGIIGSIITILLTVIFAPILLICSPGKIFFTQERIGMNGKKFKMIKFRTMVPDAEKRKEELLDQNRNEDGMMFKMDFDPRIIGNKILPDGRKKTGIGQFMRNHSIDEFPQFFNVLLGQMSLVGTRPPTVDEWEKYQLHHRARLATKPGITGLWQVSGRSEITDFEEVVKLDLQYIMDWSLGLDFKIIFKTIAIVFRGNGAM